MQSNSLTSLTRLDYLPDLVLLNLAEHMGFDDQFNFMEACPRAAIVLGSQFRKFTHLQLSDELTDTFLKCEPQQVAKDRDSSRISTSSEKPLPDDRLFFSPSHIYRVLELCVNLRSVVLAVKVSGTKPPMPLQTQSPPACPLFETSLYTRGGVIAQFFNEFPAERLEKLESICVNVDLIVDAFSELAVPCPTEDLRYAVHFLANKPFQTFIQIGFCANEIRQADHDTNCMLLGAMHTIAYEMNYYGCKTEIDVGDDELYCDLTVEIGKVEYSFAFFYYNPDFCEPGPSSAAGGAIEADDDIIMDDDILVDNIYHYPVNGIFATEHNSPGIDLDAVDLELFQKHVQQNNILNAPFGQKLAKSSNAGY